METAVQRLPIHAEPLLQQWAIILFESITIIFDFVVTVNQTLSTYTHTRLFLMMPQIIKQWAIFPT